MKQHVVILCLLLVVAGGCGEKPIDVPEETPTTTLGLALDLVSKGMTTNQVQEAFGKPENTVVDADGVEVWFYFQDSEHIVSPDQLGGLQVAISNGTVIEVLPIMVQSREQ